jgi:hypothetical protein
MSRMSAFQVHLLTLIKPWASESVSIVRSTTLLRRKPT